MAASSVSDTATSQQKAAAKTTPPLSPAQEQVKHHIEFLLPLCALVEFRQLASTEHYDRLRVAGPPSPNTASPSKKNKDGSKSSSWYGSWWGGSKKAAKVHIEPFPEVEVEERTTKAALSASAPATSSYAVDLTLESNAATLSLTSSSIPVATMSLACTSQLTYLPDDGPMSCSLSMTCLSVKDEVTRQPVVPYLVTVAVATPTPAQPLPLHLSSSHTTETTTPTTSTMTSVSDVPAMKYPLAISYTLHHAKKQSSLVVSSLPLLFCWNPLCISQLLDMITLLPYHENLSEDQQLVLKRRAEVLQCFQRRRCVSLAQKKRHEAMAQTQIQTQMTHAGGSLPGRSGQVLSCSL